MYLQYLALHLSYADYIIALDEKGRVSEHGSFEEISKSGAYIKNLFAQPVTVPTSRVPEVELSDETLEELELPEDDQDTRRQMGDLTVYTYYFRAVGWGLMSALIISCGAFVFGLTFPGIQSYLY